MKFEKRKEKDIVPFFKKINSLLESPTENCGHFATKVPVNIL